MRCQASVSELIPFVPVDSAHTSGFSWNRLYHAIMQVHISWFSSRMWIMFGQVVSGVICDQASISEPIQLMPVALVRKAQPRHDTYFLLIT
jgi:hypothetical protein